MFCRRLLLLAPIAALVAACATPPAAPVPVADAIAREPSLSTFNGLVTKAGLLNGAGPYTVFAPTNEAFAAVPAKAMDELARDPARLKAVLGYHVVPARLTASEIHTQAVKSVQGGNLSLAKAGDFVTVEDAMVQKADIAASNGVVHTVDRVLMPPR